MARSNPERILAMRKAYEAGAVSVVEIARSFGTSAGAVQRLARAYEWTRRQPNACSAQQKRRERERSLFLQSLGARPLPDSAP